MRKINPSVKGGVILICGLIISFQETITGNLLLIAVCLSLLLIARAQPSRIAKFLLPVTLAAASIFMAFAFNGSGGGTAAQAAEAVQAVQTVQASSSYNFLQMSTGGGNLYTGAAVALRIYAYAFLGMLFTFTTEPQEFLYSLMQQCRLSPKFAYSVLTAYHLIPMITREYRQIRLACEVRGESLKPWSLKPALPALVNAVHWAENAAMAMQSKGFDENAPRTWYLVFRVRLRDLLWGAGMIILVLFGGRVNWLT